MAFTDFGYRFGFPSSKAKSPPLAVMQLKTPSDTTAVNVPVVHYAVSNDGLAVTPLEECFDFLGRPAVGLRRHRGSE
jgi:hypothetical protein